MGLINSLNLWIIIEISFSPGINSLGYQLILVSLEPSQF